MVCKVVPTVPDSPRGRARTDQQPLPQDVADYETALDAAGYGRFSQLTLGACACAFFTTGVQNCVMSYVLPAARCELYLSTYQSGLVNMAFMCDPPYPWPYHRWYGGVASAFFWGITGDVFGRRNILSMTLLLDSLILLAQSVVTDYRVLLAARSINGFLIGGPSTLVFSYLSDLVGARRRQFYLNITGMSFVAAWLVIPAVAWLVIPIKTTNPTIMPLYSWRLFLALGSLPGFLCGVWVMLLPESPRLLADTDRADEALIIFKRIYRINGGNEKDFKIKKLIVEKVFAAKSFSEDHSRMKELLMGVLGDLKIFVSKGYAVKSSLILLVFFANMAAGFGLNMWIPELLLRMQVQDCQISKAVNEPSRLVHPINSTLWKEVSQGHHSDDIEKTNGSVFNNFSGQRRRDYKCNDEIDDDIFISSIVVGGCCVALNAGCAVLSARYGALGVRRGAAACAAACACACACLAACACACAASTKVAVAAAAALNAASLNGNVLLIRMLLFALPAKLSGLGVCWGAWWGRAGGVVSNLAVGALLDYSCPAPFISVAALIAVSVVAIMMIKFEETKVTTAHIGTDDISSPKNIALDKYISTHM